MKLLGIDFGQRRIGIAVTDTTGLIARAVTTIDRKVTPQYLREIEKILAQEAPEKIIFGLPLGPNDEETEWCAKIKKFQSKLYDTLQLELPYAFQDESYSSVRTKQILLTTRKKKGRADKGAIDRLAACIILEDYLQESSGSYLLY